MMKNFELPFIDNRIPWYFLLPILIFYSCDIEEVSVDLEELNMPSLNAGSTVHSTKFVPFSKSDGNYSVNEAASDFGNIQGWDDPTSYISSNTCRIRLAPGIVGASAGMVSEIDVADGSEYEIEYKVKFHSAFEWARGGKLGFGLKIGDGVVACRGQDAKDGDGGSFRVMWYNNGNNDTEVYFYPYLYFAGMTRTCGDTYRTTNRYPASGAISRGLWYTIKLYYKANTGTASDGVARMYVNGTLVLDENNIQWSTTTDKKKVKEIYFSVFRGGSESSSNADDWRSNSVGYIYFDDLKWTRLSS